MSSLVLQIQSNHFTVKLNTSNSFFFPHVIIEWNRYDSNNRSSIIYIMFLNGLLKFTRLIKRKTFNVTDSFGMKMLTRLRLGFSNLWEHKIKDCFKDTLSLACSCRKEAKTLTHYLLHFHFFNEKQTTLMNELGNCHFCIG